MSDQLPLEFKQPSEAHQPSVAGPFLIWLGVIFVLKWPTLTEPPRWDAVWGLFPAAGELADNGFNVLSLLKQPNCLKGGPNCHSESIVTWVTAFVLWLFGKGPTAFLVLHVLHFSVAAWTLAVLQQFATKTMGRTVSWMLCLTLLLCPLFRVQVGAMYLEIPLAACTVAAVVAYANGQLGRAILWSTLAVMVKESGLVVAGALSAAALFRSVPIVQRFGLATGFAVPGLVAAFWPLATSSIMSGLKDRAHESWWDFFTFNHWDYLKVIPDILAVCGLFLMLGMFRLREVWRSLAFSPPADATLAVATHMQKCSNDVREAPAAAEETKFSQVPTSALGMSYLLVIMFALFFFVTPYYARLQVFCLPRYFVGILPWVFFGLIYWLTSYTSARRAVLFLSVISLLFVGNRNGSWYLHQAGNDLSQHERAESYRWLLEAQREASQTASQLPDDAVIYYGLGEHFHQLYPWLGYASRQHPGGRWIWQPEYRPKSAKPVDLPDHYFVVLTSGVVGGHELMTILKKASVDSSRKVSVFRRCQHGPFAAIVYEVTTVKATAESPKTDSSPEPLESRKG